MSDDPNQPPPPDPAPAADDWRASLPEDLKADQSLATFKNVAGLAKSYVETKRLVGQKGVRVPTDASTPEEIAEYRKALGVPDSPESYQITRPSVAANGGWDDEAEKAFLGVAHKAGIPPRAVQEVVTWYGSYLAQQIDAAQREAVALAQELRREWGANYDAMIGQATRAVKEYGGDALAMLLEETGYGRHPVFVRAFAKIGQDLVEHGAMQAEGYELLGPEETASRIASLQAQMKTYPEGHPKVAEIIDQILALTRAQMPRK